MNRTLHDIRDYLTEEEFIKMRYDENLGCATIKDIIGFGGHENTLRRQARILGWLKPVKEFEIDREFFNRDSRESMWLLGWIYTDGHVNEKLTKLAVAKKDVDVLEKMRKHTSYTGNINEGKSYYVLTIHGKGVSQTLFNRGIPTKNKTYECSFPIIPKGYEWDFIRGAFEGDGSIVSARGQLQLNLCGVANDFIMGVNSFLNSNGIKTRVERRDDGVIVLLSKNIEDAIRWSYFMYNNTSEDIRLDRKFNRFKTFVNSFYDHKRVKEEAIELVELARQTIPECSDNINAESTQKEVA